MTSRKKYSADNTVILFASQTLIREMRIPGPYWVECDAEKINVDSLRFCDASGSILKAA